VALLPLFVTVAVALSGCSVHVTPVAPTRSSIARIGLPVYPGSRPVQGEDISQNVGSMNVNTLDAGFTTSDTLDKVASFYQAKVPKTAQRLNLSMGFATGVTFQFYEGVYQKQVVIVSAKNVRMIWLKSMQLLQTPAASASP